MDPQYTTLHGMIQDYRVWLNDTDTDEPCNDEARTDWMYDIALAAIDFVDTRHKTVV